MKKQLKMQRQDPRPRPIHLHWFDRPVGVTPHWGLLFGVGFVVCALAPLCAPLRITGGWVSGWVGEAVCNQNPIL